jgi:SAM-dependent methyltransferase
MTTSHTNYLLAGQTSELERLQLQSRVWEPAGKALMAKVAVPGPAVRALEVGCGAMGWIRVLSEWLGDSGSVTATDVDERMLELASAFVREEGISNVRLLKDDIFHTGLEAHSFDVVHARFQIAPLGRAEEQMAVFLQLLKPGGRLILEDPDMGSWHVTPSSAHTERLIDLIRQGFLQAGGNFDAGRELPQLMRRAGLRPTIDACVIALEPNHPYLRLPLQFAKALRPRLEALLEPGELDRLVAGAEQELAREGLWGTTFTLIQAMATTPHA